MRKGKTRKSPVKSDPLEGRLVKWWLRLIWCLILLWFLDTFWEIFLDISFLSSRAWLELSAPYAILLAIVTAIWCSLVFVSLYVKPFLEEEGSAAFLKSLSLRDKAYWLLVFFGSPFFAGFLMCNAITSTFPLVFTAISGEFKQEEYTFESADLSWNRHCSPRMFLHDSVEGICGIFPPVDWQAGDKIIAAGKGSYFGIFVDNVRRSGSLVRTPLH